MSRVHRIITICALVSAVLLAVPAYSQTNEVTELAFLVDGSGSISGADFSIMLNGIANAVSNPSCVPHDGGLELTVIQFASNAQLEVAPTRITSQADADRVAALVRGMGKLGSSTNYADAFNLAANTLRFVGSRQVINITTDGGPNEPSASAHIAAVQNAINRGIDEIDAEGIALSTAQQSASGGIDAFNADPITVLRDQVVHPQPGLLSPPASWPPSKGGWVRLVSNAQEFANSVCQKFQIVLDPDQGSGGTVPPTATPGLAAPVNVPEPVTIMLFGSGLAALAGVAARRRRKGGA